MSNQKSGKTKKRKPILGLEDNDEDKELKYLESIVLGDGSDVVENITSEEIVREKKRKIIKEPAWVDEEDTVGGNGPKKYDPIFRERKFQQVSKKPKWAEEVSSQETNEDEILKKCGKFFKKPGGLQQGTIEIKKLLDLNNQTHNEGIIKAIKFHPKSSVALVAGLAGVISIFQVDGKENTKLQSTKYKNFPIDCASFVNDGNEYIIGSGSSRVFHTFNLITGKSFKLNNSKIDGINNMKTFTVSPDDRYIAVIGSIGKIYLLSARTKECLDSFQLNSKAGAISFGPDGSTLYSHSEEGDVYIWDIRTRKCIQKFTDDGCLNGTTLDVSSNNSFLSCGSSSGVVNLYDIKSVMSEDYKPLKVFYNLVTPVTNVKFNPTSELLCISSIHKEKAVKLIHLSSRTVFSNFPIVQTKMHHITCIDFSPNSGYMALGDSRKIAHLYRLKYYGNY